MPTILELRAARAKAVHDARAIYKLADEAKRSPTADEQRQFDEHMAESDRIGDQITKLEKLEATEKVLEQSAGRSVPATAVSTATATPGRASEGYQAAFRSFIRHGFLGMSPSEVRAIEEVRALQADNAVQAGFLIAPQQFLDELIKFVDNLVFVRNVATKFTVPNAASLGVPTLDTDPDDADWTSELNTGAEDGAMAFGKRELYPRPVAKRIKLSNKLLRMVPKAESLVMARLGYKFGVTQEKAFLTGNGQNQPLGVFTASASGITTGRDITSGTAGALKADDLIAVKYNLKWPYQSRPDTRWCIHRLVMKVIRQLKDANGQYLWQPSGLGTNITADGLDRVLEIPVVPSEYAPSTITTGQYALILGAWSFYWIADAESFTVQRLQELYAETNQTGFIGRLEVDGMPVLEEAWSRLKIG